MFEVSICILVSAFVHIRLTRPLEIFLSKKWILENEMKPQNEKRETKQKTKTKK
jgi:hypothetical protein